MMLKGAKKFQFDTIFASDAEISGKKPPVYSEDDLALERDQAYEQGKADGWQQAIEGLERGCIEQLKVEFSLLMRQQKEMEEAAYRQVAEMGAQILRRLLPHFVDQGAFEEIKTVVREAFESVEEKKLEITVRASMKERIERLVTAFAGVRSEDYKAVVLEDSDLPGTDVLVRWHGGGLERRMERIQEEIEKALQRLGASKSERQKETAVTLTKDEQEDIKEGHSEGEKKHERRRK